MIISEPMYRVTVLGISGIVSPVGVSNYTQVSNNAWTESSKYLATTNYWIVRFIVNGDRSHKYSIVATGGNGKLMDTDQLADGSTYTVTIAPETVCKI